MKAPICGVCLKSGILCRSCKEKVDSGKVSETDVDVSRSILKMSGRIKPLKEISIERVLDSENLMVIVCRKGEAARIIGRDGLVVKKLEKEIGKPVRIVEGSGDVEGTVKDLLFPAVVSGINILYRQGEEVLKVIVGKGPDPHIRSRDFRNIIKMIYDKDIEISK